MELLSCLFLPTSCDNWHSLEKAALQTKQGDLQKNTKKLAIKSNLHENGVSSTSSTSAFLRIQYTEWMGNCKLPSEVCELTSNHSSYRSSDPLSMACPYMVIAVKPGNHQWCPFQTNAAEMINDGLPVWKHV